MKGLSWKIGQVEIFQIVELEAGEIIQSIIKGYSKERIKELSWLYPNFADERGNLKAQVQAFLIRSENKNILIDACNGNGKSRTDVPIWNNLNFSFLEKLQVDVNDIDIVACTHLHMDHVGWNTKLHNGDWIPTFPNAKYIFLRKEYEYWSQRPENEIADDKAAFDDSVYPIVKAGLAQLVELNYNIDSNVRFEPAPGHTPNHACVIIESLGERAIISGDFIHHPCQIANPEWGTDSDSIPEIATKTRKDIIEDIADTNTILIGSHFPNPVVGRVRRREKGFVFEQHF